MSLLPHPAGAAWFCAGSTAAYPDLDDTARIAAHRHCLDKYMPGCRIFHVPRHDTSQAVPIAIDDWNDAAHGDSKDQVMVFKYKGHFVAINHECPHSSYPLSNATLFDIEDFGVVLSSGITCPQHHWSFDLFTGKSDRGTYKLQIWEVQQRPSQAANDDMDLWVRRKQKIG
ncbi:hypothetical protein ACEQ8H_005920 [Pleosporales sp. CAS-2024a]